MKEDLIIAVKKLLNDTNSSSHLEKIGNVFLICGDIELSMVNRAGDKPYILYNNIKCEITLDEKTELEKLFLTKEKQLSDIKLDLKIEYDYNMLKKYINS